MAINKVVYGTDTLMDITDTTATSEDVANGKVFYSASGIRAVGTASGGSGGIPTLSGSVYIASLDDGVYYLTSGSTVYTFEDYGDTITDIDAGGTLTVSTCLDLSSSGVVGKKYFLIHYVGDYEFNEYPEIVSNYSELYSGVVFEESGDWWYTRAGEKIEDLVNTFKINNVNISSNGVVNLMTEGTYNSTSNKLVTKSYVDNSVVDTSAAIAPEYVPMTAYSIGDYVMHEGNLYVYSADIVLPTPGWVSADWTQTSVSEILGNINTTLGGI